MNDSYSAIKLLREVGKNVSVFKTVRAIGRLCELGSRRARVKKEEIDRIVRFLPKTMKRIEAKRKGDVKNFIKSVTPLNIEVVTDSYVKKKRDVTICTHCSVDRLEYLIEMMKLWDGPLSVAVYARSKREKDSVYSLAFKNRSNLIICIACKKRKKKNDIEEYPINALRNVALSRARSDIVLNLDIDLIPSRRLYQRLTEKHVYDNLFVEDDIVWIVPAFELDCVHVKQVPRTRRHLRVLWCAKLASGFQMSHYPPGHRATHHARWLASLDSQQHDTNGYNVKYEEGFEPYVLCKRENIPIFDERFEGYGKNKTIHSYRLHHSGYTFRVLPPLGFLVSRVHPRSRGWINMYHPIRSNSVVRRERNSLYQIAKLEIEKQSRTPSSAPFSCCRRHLLVVAPSATGKTHFVRSTQGKRTRRVADADKLVGRLIGWDRLAQIPDTKYKNRVMWEELFLWLSLQTIPTALFAPPYGGISELSTFEGFGFLSHISVVFIDEYDHRFRLNSRKMDIQNGIVSSSKPKTWKKIERHRQKLRDDVKILRGKYGISVAVKKSFEDALSIWS